MAPILDLIGFRLKGIRISLGDNTDKEGQIGLRYEQEVNPNNHRQYKLVMKVKYVPPFAEGKPTAPEAEGEIEGFFQVPENTPEERKEHIAKLYGCAMLYGVLRGQFSIVGGSFNSGTVILPALNMAEIIQTVEERGLDESSSKEKEQVTN
jgi:preprotein translocase subunit SecB